MFPSGMGFLKFKYPEQWAEGEAILGRLASEFRDLVRAARGASLLHGLRARHVTYGEALRITKAKAVEPETEKLGRARS